MIHIWSLFIVLLDIIIPNIKHYRCRTTRQYIPVHRDIHLFFYFTHDQLPSFRWAYRRPNLFILSNFELLRHEFFISRQWTPISHVNQKIYFLKHKLAFFPSVDRLNEIRPNDHSKLVGRIFNFEIFHQNIAWISFTRPFFTRFLKLQIIDLIKWVRYKLNEVVKLPWCEIWALLEVTL